MKILVTVVLLAAASLCGCASAKITPGSAAVAPQPSQTRAVDSDGRLVVYSVFDSDPEFYPATPYHRAYSDYEILGSDGRLLEKVHNNSNDVFGGPASIRLPPGNYRVVAPANDHRLVSVPVVIEASRTTTVRVDTALSPGDAVAGSGTVKPVKP